MIVLRSIAFNIFFFVFHLALVMVMTMLLAFPRRLEQRVVRLWTHLLGKALKTIVGLDIEIRGRENLPPGAIVIVSKHQSAWDTFVFYTLVDDPNYILKKELIDIPFWGWCAAKCGAIGVDRDGGASALKKMVRDTQDRIGKGRQVIIFPEGTRAKPGKRHPYHPGIAAIYGHTDAPVIPVALNSGLFWGRGSFVKYPGVVTIEFLSPMPAGLKRREFMIDLERRIEGASDALLAEAKAKFSYLKP
ncbi:MAG: lysophospholipid acyltransferase family protein [Proteobacteria bacterium]|nr:lysophospholipid acyltransferase family protein [Pseudomonadota bacterium]MDA1022535.1 lysophospholipid acyltransferase family protein [Pseudomonadota bacterium]